MLIQAASVIQSVSEESLHHELLILCGDQLSAGLSVILVLTPERRKTWGKIMSEANEQSRQMKRIERRKMATKKRQKNQLIMAGVILGIAVVYFAYAQTQKPRKLTRNSIATLASYYDTWKHPSWRLEDARQRGFEVIIRVTKTARQSTTDYWSENNLELPEICPKRNWKYWSELPDNRYYLKVYLGQIKTAYKCPKK
ncbi:hypothetical protein GCM10017044_18600 [Kordiimonas sediminis]|uniref:Uncharacterized protein n=1 Tax=Kordiimonas sediminis TaxID=1735581 RepID=A0A919E843_9PROT|nr:hypothetical protein [Kordiimonas sediminis]GHF24263.1 hypothetical protein GCM10017044_18600 [Kordiimonas sediminis]